MPKRTASKGNTYALKHGHRSNGKPSPTYRSWRAMIDRCTREGHPYYHHYGGRGVQVDPSWLGRGGFTIFLYELGERPDGTTLDRIDVNGHYTADNCRWSTPQVQRWNRRDMLYPQPEVPEEYHLEPLWRETADGITTDTIPF